MGPTILFTHLKIILLQCFQFSVFSNNKFNPNTPKVRIKVRVCYSLGVSNKTVTQPTHTNPSDLARQLADPTSVTIGGRSWPPKPKNGESVGRFSLQNPKIPDRTEISAFPVEVFLDLARSQLDPGNLH